MEMSKINMRDHRRIARARDHHSPNMIMIKNQTTNNPNPKEYSWNYDLHNNNQTRYDQDQEDYNLINAFSWPPRSYTCSFCKREFRSAQALGGHMNVHRKDRARLRQSPPSPPRDIHHGRYGSSSTPKLFNLNLNHNTNPKPNFFSSNLNITASPLCSLNSKPPLSSLLPSPYSAHDNNDLESKKWPIWTSTDHIDHQYPLIRNIKCTDKNTPVGGAGEEQHEGFAGKNHVYNCKSLKKKITETTTTSVRLDLEIGLFRAHESEIGRDLDLELRLGYSN